MPRQVPILDRKMNPAELMRVLRQAMESSDFIGEAESITENLEEEGAGLKAVAGILRFLEDHPALGRAAMKLKFGWAAISRNRFPS